MKTGVVELHTIFICRQGFTAFKEFQQALDLSIDSFGDSCYNVGAPYSRESGVATASPPL